MDWQQKYDHHFKTATELPAEHISWEEYYHASESAWISQAKKPLIQQVEWLVENKYSQLLSTLIQDAAEQPEKFCHGTLLSTAVALNNIELLRQMVNAGLDSSVVPKTAIFVQNLTYWQTLGSKSNNWNAHFKGCNAFLIAVFCQRSGIVDLLLEQTEKKREMLQNIGISVVLKGQIEDTTPKETYDNASCIHFASMQTSAAMLEKILPVAQAHCKELLDVKAKQIVWYYRCEKNKIMSGVTAMHLACVFRNTEHLKLLAKAKADLDVRCNSIYEDDSGETIYAASVKKLAVKKKIGTNFSFDE